jgi:hypothetical protein|tara:strand:+ start:1381 stop:1530 length:150 start_codon:yes stop_codon:yes gene_type:complete
VGTQNPTVLLKTMIYMIADIAKTVTNGIAIEGYSPREMVVLKTSIFAAR